MYLLVVCMRVCVPPGLPCHDIPRWSLQCHYLILCSVSSLTDLSPSVSVPGLWPPAAAVSDLGGLRAAMIPTGCLRTIIAIRSGDQ